MAEPRFELTEFASRAQVLSSCPITAETSKWQSRSVQGPGQAGSAGNLGIPPEPDGGVANGDGQGSGGSWEGRLPATRVSRSQILTWRTQVCSGLPLPLLCSRRGYVGEKEKLLLS